MSNAIIFINEVLKLQIEDIYTTVSRKKMNSKKYTRMKKRQEKFSSDLEKATSTSLKYKILNKHSQFMFQYLVQMLNKESQKSGSQEHTFQLFWKYKLD